VGTAHTDSGHLSEKEKLTRKAQEERIQKDEERTKKEEHKRRKKKKKTKSTREEARMPWADYILKMSWCSKKDHLRKASVPWMLLADYIFSDALG